MKKVFEILKDMVKAIIGIPVAIGCFEIMNIILSSMLGQYVRLDEGVFDFIIREYIGLGLFGYVSAITMIYCTKENKNEKIDTVEKTKNIIKTYMILGPILAMILGYIGGVKLSEILIMSLIFIVLFGLALVLVHLWDKKVIKKINDKVKENKE